MKTSEAIVRLAERCIVYGGHYGKYTDQTIKDQSKRKGDACLHGIRVLAERLEKSHDKVS